MKKYNLADLNDLWNRNIRYEEDGDTDYWQTPSETIQRGAGDCEDIALAKYFSLVLTDLFVYDSAEFWTVKLKEQGAHAWVVVNDKWCLDLVPEIVEIRNRIDVDSLDFVSSLSNPFDPRFAHTIARMDMEKEAAYIKAYCMVKLL